MDGDLLGSWSRSGLSLGYLWGVMQHNSATWSTQVSDEAATALVNPFKPGNASSLGIALGADPVLPSMAL